MTDGYAVERLSTHPREAVLEALRASFDQPFTDEFFHWKHVDGPWGPTDGWVAIDDEGIAGVLCCLPWDLRRGHTEVTSSRLVDGGTLPRALRRGIFGELVRHEVERCRTLPAPEPIFCTATPAARDSHVKRGATALPPLRHGIGPVQLWSAPAAIVRDDAHERYTPLDAPSIGTAWTADALAWRMDERSGYRYSSARLRRADDANGIVYRVGGNRGVRRLFVEFAWGTPREIATLLAAVGSRAGAVLWAGAVGVGAGLDRRPWVRRGESHICTWPFGTEIRAITDLADTTLWLADVEGAI